MPKMSKTVKNVNTKAQNNQVVNFMGGTNYKVSPLETLKLVSSSSIFGEPSYYRHGEFANKTSEKEVFDERMYINDLVKGKTLLGEEYIGKKTSDIMENIIDESLSYDFKGTLEWAERLRSQEFNMRLNPQIIMVRASIHKDREQFNKENPGLFAKINSKVMFRLDEPSTQLTYWLYKNKSKKGIPTVLKKTWARKYESASSYQLAKYKNAGIGMIDTMRICHPVGDKQPVINELLKTGTIKTDEKEMTWEKYISQNGSSKETWEWVIDNIFAIEVKDE